MAAYATSSKVLGEKYDVFITFRGSDIRHGFLSHLKRQLRQEWIDVYVDERLERGDEISTALLEAIERSIIALVIFSKDYASSWWCLEELVKIMECKRVNNQIVIPVFYKVDPSLVRKQEGSYADAFVQHEQKYDHDLMKVQVWKSVLKEAANLSGYHSSNFLNESDLIDEIIQDLSKKLEGQDTNEPKRQLIGFQENLACIESFMKADSKEVRVIGIWGKGGVGKTSLAQVIFDKFSPRYDGSYFVSNVREESKRSNGLACLLEKINENLTHKGRPNAQRRLHRRRVLLVLDDVDTSSQLQYLIEENISLGPNSKIIITSRDRHVLRSGGVNVVHEVKELHMVESLQLFCRYAFKQDHPKMGYEKLSKLVIEYAGGLPLALKVLGSYLNSRDTKTWESALKKLRKFPNGEIYNVLRVSYDGLDIPEKKIFLDIAFFLWGQKKELIIGVLDACDDFYAECGIDSLIDKALITISSDNTIGIHDRLQEMAEEIVREESREHPERRSRLNDSNEIQDILKNSKGTHAIEGISLKLNGAFDLNADSFKNMSNLRFLEIIQPCQTCGFHSVVHVDYLGLLCDKLSYFYWERYPWKSLPLGFYWEKLVELHMPHSKVEKLWDGVQDLMRLKTINLRSSVYLVELPDLSMAQNLKMVELEHCMQLRSIHPSVLSLPKLFHLNLIGCRELKSLQVANRMKYFKHLMLSCCSKFKKLLLSSEERRRLELLKNSINTMKLPIGRFNKIEELYLSGYLMSFQINELSCLTSLKRFTLSEFTIGRIDIWDLQILFDAWHSLEMLHLEYCAIFGIPDNISALSLLKSLSLRACAVKRLPNSIKQLSELKKIDLGQCRKLRSLPKLPPSITHLYVDDCASLETIDLKMMGAIYNNYSGEVKLCYPGNTIPKGITNSEMGKNSITIELAQSSSNPLLGIASSCIISVLDYKPWTPSIWRKFHFEDKDIYYMDKEKFPDLKQSNGDNVYVWYDPMEHILNQTQRRFDEGTVYKFACEFFVGNPFRDCRDKCDHWIVGCGIRPIYASDLQKEIIVEETELMLQDYHRAEQAILEFPAIMALRKEIIVAGESSTSRSSVISISAAQCALALKKELFMDCLGENCMEVLRYIENYKSMKKKKAKVPRSCKSMKKRTREDYRKMPKSFGNYTKGLRNSQHRLHQEYLDWMCQLETVLLEAERLLNPFQWLRDGLGENYMEVLRCIENYKSMKKKKARVLPLSLMLNIRKKISELLKLGHMLLSLFYIHAHVQSKIEEISFQRT